MDEKFYLNAQRLRDGKLLLYQRPGNKKGTWWMRVLKPNGGYLFRSTKSSSLGEASRVAEDKLDQMRDNVRNNVPEIDLNFHQLYLKWFEAKVKPKDIKRKPDIQKHHRLYFRPFFGEMNVREINDILMTEYWNFRLSYWTEGPGLELIAAKKVSRYAKTPSGSTLRIEKFDLLAVLEWGANQGYLSKVPDCEPPIAPPADKDVARPAFTLKEYKNIRGWITKQIYIDIEQDPYERPSSYSRRMYRNWLLAAFASGMRPGELFQLQWKHLSTFRVNGADYISVLIVDDTKTGRRDCVPLPELAAAIKDILGFSKYIKPDDFVFTKRDGSQVTSYEQRFLKMCKDLNIVKDVYGAKFTPYSTRHTYITHRLLYSNVEKWKIASNCGTSVEKINSNYDHTLNRQRAAELVQVNKDVREVEIQYAEALESISPSYRGYNKRSGDAVQKVVDKLPDNVIALEADK